MKAAEEAHFYEPFPSLSAWIASRVSGDSWRHYAQQLEQDRERSSEEDFAVAREVALRAAAVDTGAIEGLYQVDRGFTMTVAYQAAAWQQELAQRGEDVRDLFGAQLEAHQLVLDAATRRTPTSEAFIRQLHATLTAPQETYPVLTEQGWQSHKLPRGEYKLHPNNPYSSDGRQLYAYAPPLEVTPEMHRLVTELESKEFLQAEPYEQASYAHYAFVKIHPFADGNGRVARALSSLFLLRATSTPLVIFADQRHRYLEALRATDAGHYDAFVLFVVDQSIETMLLIRDSLQGKGLLGGSADIAFFREAVAQHGLAPSEIDGIAMRLVDIVRESFQAAPIELQLPRHLVLSFGRQDDHRGAPPGHRVISRGGGEITINLRNEGPGGREVTALMRVLPVTSSKLPHVLALEARFGEHAEQFEIVLSEVTPTFSSGLRMRLKFLATRLLRMMVSRLREHVERGLREMGWTPLA